MTLTTLPVEILGQVGPILAWAEGDFGSRLPSTWYSGARPFSERERGWVLGELPTYSYDNVDDILEGSRRTHRLSSYRPTQLPKTLRSARPRLSPPQSFDLIAAFRYLNRYFFRWNGTEPCIRDGRMEDLHELALRLPAGHIVRHTHARQVAEGVVTFDEALELPELVTLLPTNAFGMRDVVRQGLSESHLHLRGVISAEETWADNLLKPQGILGAHGLPADERRLLLLNLFAGRILALAVWMSLEDEDYEPGVGEDGGAGKRVATSYQLLELMDEIYFARTEAEEHYATERLWERMLSLVGSCDDAAFQRNHHFRFLLRWINPTMFWLQESRRSGALPGSLPERLRDRHAYVERLHLAAHLRLVQLSPRQGVDGEEDKEEEKKRREERPEARDLALDRRRYFLHEALFRYIVCRTHHWQLATQQSQTTGLRHFRKYYGASQRKLPGLSTLQEADLVLERLREWRGLRVLEGRVAPPDSPRDLVPWILAYTRPKSRRIEKMGFVVHFKKEEESKEDRALTGDNPPVPRLRWGYRRRRVRAEGMRLYRLLRQPTPVTPFIVGIDAANLELATPPEVFAPVFRFLRELPISTARSGKRRFAPYYGLEPAIYNLTRKRRLGMTYHVGEDFRHLLSGLRAIFEVVEFLNPQPGDRLGHGTALALRPEGWLEHNGFQAVLSRLEWLDTLVWVHHFLGPGDSAVGELDLDDEIQRLSWRVYGPLWERHFDPLHLAREQGEKSPSHRGLLDWNWSPLTLWDAWRLRQLDPYSLRLPDLFRGKLRLIEDRTISEEDRRWYAVQERIVRGVRKEIGSRNAYLLLALYWLSPEVRRRGAETIVVEMQEKSELWLELCHRVEAKMKALIQDREMVVEVNPSSNRIIGPMARYEQNHLFELTLDENKRLSRQVRVSVNTDNPAVCNTTLAHEHYLVGEILTRQKVPEAEVVKWLDWLRENGNAYCFARQLPTPESNPDMQALFEWLRAIRPGVREASTRGAKLESFWDWQRSTWLRRQGFRETDVARHPLMLERMQSLESALDDSTKWSDRLSVLEREIERIKALEAELQALKKKNEPDER